MRHPLGWGYAIAAFDIKILFGKQVGVNMGDRSYPKFSCQALKAETVHLFCETRVVGAMCRAHDRWQSITPAHHAHQLANASTRSIVFDSRVVARRKRAVRSQHQGRAVCGQQPARTTKVFFGDFLSPDKKLPAANGSGSPYQKINEQTDNGPRSIHSPRHTQTTPHTPSKTSASADSKPAHHRHTLVSKHITLHRDANPDSSATR